MRLAERLGACQLSLDATAEVGRDAAAEKCRVDTELAASHAIDSGVGRVLPRSIWLMYSFENRSPATWVCVSPAASRSERSRSPRREAGADGVVGPSDGADGVVVRRAEGGEVHLCVTQCGHGPRRTPPGGVRSPPNVGSAR